MTTIFVIEAIYDDYDGSKYTQSIAVAKTRALAEAYIERKKSEDILKEKRAEENAAFYNEFIIHSPMGNDYRVPNNVLHRHDILKSTKESLHYSELLELTELESQIQLIHQKNIDTAKHWEKNIWFPAYKAFSQALGRNELFEGIDIAFTVGYFDENEIYSYNIAELSYLE